MNVATVVADNESDVAVAFAAEDGDDADGDDADDDDDDYDYEDAYAAAPDDAAAAAAEQRLPQLAVVADNWAVAENANNWLPPQSSLVFRC